GDVTSQGAAEGIARVFGGLSGRADPARSVSAVGPAARRAHPGAGPQGPTPTRVVVTGGGAGAAIGGLGPDVADLEALRVGFVAARAIGRRLDAALRGHMPGAGARVEAFVAPSQVRRGLGAMVVQGALAQGSWAGAQRAHSALVRELLRIAQDGLGADEVAGATAAAAQDAAQRLGSRVYWASVLATSALYGHDPEDLARAQGAYRAITPDQVNRRLREWLRPGSLGGVIYGPAAETGAAVGGGV
ncbi:MAG: hypothetical protein C0468_05300, partial [Planctomyces sp.]|nr:hypothetical protein [Planctomyces sp.]